MISVFSSTLSLSDVMVLLCCHRDNKHSAVLEQEVDALCVDRHGNTPLVCRHPLQHTVIMYSYSSGHGCLLSAHR